MSEAKSTATGPQVSSNTKAIAGGPFRMAMNGTWWLAADPEDIGATERWQQDPPRKSARSTEVPSALQETLPGFHGVAWYWRDFRPLRLQTDDGRYLMRFEAVDHAASVWVNGMAVGQHEGGETPFLLDVTDVLRPEEMNRVVVRVVNPTTESIDGLRLDEVAHRNRRMPFVAGGSWNLGGITGSVNLLLVPPARIDDLRVRTAPETRNVHVDVELFNASADPVAGTVTVSLASHSGGDSLVSATSPVQVEARSSTTVEFLLCGAPLETWDLDHPSLYRATAALDLGASGSTERSTRFGVRDFRFSDGAFRLNGKRMFLRMTHTVNDYPLTGDPSTTAGLLRRDLVHLKTLGFTMVRFIWGAATPEQLDLCDELGLLVYSESFAAWPIDDSPHMRTRLSEAVEGLIRRDRNHPCITIWGLLNESFDQPAFQCAVDMLPQMVAVDGTRMFGLNSGRFDQRPEVASFANPGSEIWDVHLGSEGNGKPAEEAVGWPPTDGQPMGTGRGLGDMHVYPRVPHTNTTICHLRELGQSDAHPIFVTEYGVGSAVDLWRVVRKYEEYGAEAADDAVYYRAQLDHFREDWERWRLGDVFGHPSRFFAASVGRNGDERVRGIDALRANPRVVGYGLTGAVDQVMCGEGLASTFRELKAGTVDALTTSLAPSRWCVFASAENAYPGAPVRFEAFLANDGVLTGENLPILAQVFSPDGREVWRHAASLSVLAGGQRAAAMVFPALDQTVHLAGPVGEYNFLIGLERGGAPTGGTATVHVIDRLTPPDGLSCTVIGTSDRSAAVVDVLGPGTTVWERGPLVTSRPVVLWDDRPAEDAAAVAAGCGQVLADGGTVICLSAQIYARLAADIGADRQGPSGEPSTLHSWLYLRDDWARRHPIFAGLQSGGLLEYATYRDLISDEVLRPGDVDVTAIAGAIKASQGYDSALTMWERRIGRGRLVGSTFRLRELVGSHPVADRMLVNLVAYGASTVTR